MNSYIARVGKIVGAGLLGLMASPSATAMETSPTLQENRSYEASLNISNPDNLESRLTTDLELTKNKPLEFIRGFEDRYTPEEVSQLKKDELFDEEVDYVTKLVSNIRNPGVRLLSLYAASQNLGHSEILDETLELANSESASFLERNSAIEHLGYLFNSDTTDAGELVRITNTLNGILTDDLRRIQSERITESDLPNYLVIQAMNSAQKLLQIHPNEKESNALMKTVYELSVDPSSNWHVTEHGAFILDSVYKPKDPKKLGKVFEKAAKKFPEELFGDKIQKKDFLNSIDEGIEELVDVLDKEIVHLSGNRELIHQEPRFVYMGEDPLENLNKRFEKVYGKSNPSVKVTGSKYKEETREFLDEFKRRHPDEWLTFALTTEEVESFYHGGSSSAHEIGRIRISKEDYEPTQPTSKDLFERIRGTVNHESGHLLHHQLGLSIEEPSHLEEERVWDWTYFLNSKRPSNKSLSERMDIKVEVGHWKKH